MSDELLHYYQKELTFIREMGTEFARRYPKIAGRLQLEPDKCEDPHTERLIEAFALLAGRIHKRIDDHFPEITSSLFQVIYPHYIAPIPSMSVVCLDPLKGAIPPTGYRVDRGTVLHSKPVAGIPCQFTTAYPVTLWPIEVAAAALVEPKRPVRSAQQVLELRLAAENNLTFEQLPLKELRFFLNGTPQHVYPLYEAIFNNVCHVEVSWRDGAGRQEAVSLGRDAIREVGFEPGEALLPYDERTHSCYPLLFEYFCFPEKFLFFDLSGLDKLAESGAGNTIELSFYLDRSLSSHILVTRSTFCLNASPVVNLFRRAAEPIHIDHQRSDYQIVPDLRRGGATEVFSVDRVVSSKIGSGKGTVYRPLYSVNHSCEGSGTSARAYWHLRREFSGKAGDDGTEVFISFADLDFNPADPAADVVHIQLTCTNRDLPGRLAIGDPTGDFDTEAAAPVAAIRAVVKPTPPLRPSLGSALQWRLISHLSLNYLSLADAEPLKEILKLYDVDDSPATRQQIDGIVSLQSRFVTRRIGSSFNRGVEVTITFDGEKYVGAGVYLFACVLERFIGHYVSLNSFTRLVAETLQRKERLKAWPPRNGRRILL